MTLNNSVRDTIAAGGRARLGQMNTASTIAAEVLATCGWDGIVFDMQHGAIDLGSLLPLIQAISGTDATPFVRVPWLDPISIMKSLDAGAYGIICPMVNSRAEAEAFVAAAMYPPAGYRSFGPYRAGLYGGGGYATQVNDRILTLAMVETASAVENLEEIIATPGLSGVYVGPADLSRALGGPFGADWADGPVRDVIADVLALSKTHGKFTGIYCNSGAYAQEMLDLGFDYVVVESELSFIRARSEEILATLA